LISSVLVLDANIIIRAVLGNKVRNYLLKFYETVDFFTPDICIEEVRKNLPTIFEKRNISPQPSIEVFKHVQNLLQIVDENLYTQREIDAKKRMKRDINDWPVVATALLFNCAIWTEDKDFFGVGIPLWTTDRVNLFFDFLQN
jgi:predicted nucleic acid-binding protein